MQSSIAQRLGAQLRRRTPRRLRWDPAGLPGYDLVLALPAWDENGKEEHVQVDRGRYRWLAYGE